MESGGTLTQSGVAYLGYNAGDAGTATVTGTGSTWTTTSTLRVGSSGTGTLNIESGGTVDSSTGLVASLTGSVGTATVTGAGSSWSNSSTLDVGNDGGGTLNVENGGSVSSPSGYIGNVLGSVGTATVTGTGSSWTNSIILSDGNYGTGTLNVESGGSVSDASGYIGNYSGSTGTATVTGTGSTWTSTGVLYVGNSGTGTLNVQSGGSMSDGTGQLGYASGSTGMATVTGTGSSWINSGYFVAGESGAGTLNVESGGSVSDANAELGYASSALGTVTVTGAGSSWANSSNLYVGDSGAGTVNVESGGTVNDVSAYIGYNSSSNGTATVTGASSSWTNSSNLYVGYSGTGTLTISNAGAVSSGGTVYIANQAGSTGTLNIGAASGSGAAAAGTLTAATVAFGAGTGTLVFNHTSSDYVFAPAISGSGSIDVMAGTTVLTGNSGGFTGTAAVSSGATLEADGNLAGTLNVASGGKLQGTSTLANSLSLPNGATIAPGTTAAGFIGALTVSGNYTQGSGATMATTLSPSAAGKLGVSGTAALGGSLLLTPTAGTYIRGASYDILTAGSVSGSFASVTDTAPGIVQLGVSYAGNDVVVTTESGITNFTSNAATTDQRNIGAALDAASPGVSSGSFNTMLNTLSGLGSAGRQQALDQLNGHVAAGLQSSASGNMHAVLDSIGARLGGDPGGQSVLAGDFGPSGEVQVADASNMTWGPDPALLSDYAVWMQGVDGGATLGSNGTGPGMSSTLGGVTFGIEWQPTHEDRLGVAFGAVSADIGIDGTGQSGQQTTYVTGLYGSHDWDRFVLDGSTLVGINHATTQRPIAFLSEQASGVTDGYGVGLDTGLGYRVDLDGGDTTLTPRMGIGYTFNSENAYTETGAPGANLAVGRSEQNLLETSLGATLATRLLVSRGDTGTLDTLRPEVSLGWQHDVLNPSASANEAFAGIASSSFTTVSASPGRDAANVGAGFSYTLGDIKAFTLYARYDGYVSANQIANIATGGFKYSW